MYGEPCGPTRPCWSGRVCLSRHTYTPAEVPGLLAGWEIGFYEEGNHISLTLWRVRAYLKPYKETRKFDDEEGALSYSGGNYGSAYLPVGYTQEDLEEALQELVWKCQQINDMVEERETSWEDPFPISFPRPTLSEYIRR